MGLNLIRWSVHDINAATIRHPSRHAGREVLVRVLDPAIMLVLKRIVFAVRVGITTVPERLDKLLALLFVGELHESFSLVVRNDPTHVFVEPFLVIRAQFSLEGLPVFLLALLTDRPLERIAGLVF